MDLLLTLPHGKPEATDNHDQGALEMLPILTAALKSADVEHEIVVGTSIRSLVDLNRREAYSTKFMHEVRKHLKEARIHIDLHSFPPTSEEATDEEGITATGDDLRDWSKSEVVLFDIHGVTDDELLESLRDRLEDCCTVDVVPNETYNYVTTVASVLFDVPSVLVELNEGARRDYPAIAEALVVGAVDYLVPPVVA
jgi:hypothetical protein